MGKLARIAILAISLLATVAALAGPAAASSWTNTGDTSFTATSGPVSISNTAVTLACGASQMVAVAGTSSPTTPWLGAMAGTFTFASCPSGGLNDVMRCRFSLAVGGIAAAGPPAVIAGQLRVPAGGCLFTNGPTTICSFSGTMLAAYTNPLAPSTFARLDWPTNFTMTVANPSGRCPWGVGVVGFTAATWTLTAAAGGPAPDLGPFLSEF